MSRRAVASSVAALAVFSLAACATSNAPIGASSSHHASAAAASSEAAAPAGSASTALASRLEAAFAKGRSAHVMLDLGATGTGTGDIDFGGTSPSMDIKLSGSQTGSAEMRLIGGALYVKSATAGTGWVRFDASSTAAAGLNPTSFLGQFKDLRGGTDLGNGHWHVNEGTGIAADIYFGHDGLLQKTAVQDGQGGTSVTITYSDWGTKVVVQAPPADQVTDVSPGTTGTPTASTSPAS